MIEMIKNIFLNVQTVPAFDAATYSDHTAYTVFTVNEGCIETASGWTLRDAIDLYARLYEVDRGCIKLMRPFRPQNITQSFINPNDFPECFSGFVQEVI